MAEKGHGATIEFGTSSYTAEVVGIAGTGRSRRALGTSHSGTTSSTGMTFIPADLVNYGGLRVTVNVDSEAQPPIEADPETITLKFRTRTGDTNPPQLSGTGFVTGDDFNIPTGGGTSEEGIVTGSFTIVWSQKPTLTAGS